MTYSYVSVEDEKKTSGETEPDTNKHWREESKFLFKWLIALYILLNCIEGVLPCMLPSIAHRFSLNPTEQGILF